jgi:stalled ribosome alternative rescue factor ArfA
VSYDAPKVKQRKHFAPATKTEKPKKGKGSYERSKTFDENVNIEKFIESILTKNYAAADKYIKQAVECKLQNKIEQELSTPLF